MLWYLMKYIDSEKFRCALVVNHLGPLVADLPNSTPCFHFSPPAHPSLTLPQRAIRKLKNRFFSKKASAPTPSYEQYVTSVHESFRADVWYINTVLCPEAVELAIKLQVPYVVHFHDLLFLYQHISYDNLRRAVEGARLLVGCSKVVCEKLEVMGGHTIALQYECIDISKINVNKANAELIKNKLNISNSFVWVMSGSVEYRKGTDIIPALARGLGKSVTILWLGPGSSGYSYYIDQELKYYGLDNVHMLGPKSADYYDYLSIADGLVLTSREDPFPLVMIEAAAMGKPIVAFNSGGVSEFVQKGMGIVIDSFVISDLVDAMRKIATNEVELSKKISIARAQEFDARTQTRLWETMIENKLIVSNTTTA